VREPTREPDKAERRDELRDSSGSKAKERLIGVGVGRFDGINGNYWQREQLSGAGDVLGTLAAGEQAIVADAVEACGQHVHEEAADELVARRAISCLRNVITFRPAHSSRLSTPKSA
jgi:hypothetical protein